MSMQIRSFTVENFKRIKNAKIDLSNADSALILIGGKNGAGKSSALDALAVALWGSKMSPANPIREGQTTAEVVVELEGYIVRRTWKRAESGEIQTDVTVTTSGKDKARLQKPQSWLDARLSKLACDPVAFLALEPAKQAEMLRKLVGIDTTALDGRIEASFTARADLRRDGEKEKAVLANMPKHDDAPADPVVPEVVQAQLVEAELVEAPQTSPASILEEIAAAELTERAAEAAGRVCEDAKSAVLKANIERSEVENRISRIRAELRAAEEELPARIRAVDARAAERDEAVAALDVAAAAIIPTAPLRSRLAGLEAENKAARDAAQAQNSAARAKAAEANAQAQRDAATQNAAARAAADIANDKRRANAAYATKSAEVDRLRAEWTAKNNEVEALRAEKAALLAAAKFPVPGLSFGEKGGVTFQGQPLDQASGAEKIRVSMAIALASAPAGDDGIKLVLIRDASLLDEDSMELVAALVDEAGAQAVVERVGTRDPGAIIIVDGGTV